MANEVEVTEQEAREAAARRKSGGYVSEDAIAEDEVVLIEWAMRELANREPFSLQQLPANLDAVVRQPTPPDASGKASDCKWVVGQWVEFDDRIWKIEAAGSRYIAMRCEDSAIQVDESCYAEVSPFEWQVGRTYKTTIDGVTVTIQYVEKNGNLSGRTSYSSVLFEWCHKTGEYLGLSIQGALLPYLADEQPTPPDVPPVEHTVSKIERVAQKALKKMDEANESLRQSELKIKNEEVTFERIFGYRVGEIGDKLDRLQSFEKVAEALWPFVRYFIIAGACPEAINCVVDLGRLLGHTEASKSTIAEIGERVRAETLDEVAARLETLLRGKVLSKYLPEVLDAVRKL